MPPSRPCKHGANDADTQGLIAKAQYQPGKYKDAATDHAEIVSKQEQARRGITQAAVAVRPEGQDDAGAGKAVERLVTLYPETRLLGQRTGAAGAHGHQGFAPAAGRLSADERRWRAALPTDYAEMAEIALDQGYPGRDGGGAAGGISRRTCSPNSVTRIAISICSTAPSSARPPISSS